MMSFIIDLHCAGKVNNITIDKCTKMGVVFSVSRKICENRNLYLWMPKDGCGLTHYFDFEKQDVVAACEVVNCNSVEVQCQVCLI